MSDWCRSPIQELLTGWWPGEWGSDPVYNRSTAVVYRSTELDDDGHVYRSSVQRYIPEAKLASKKLAPGDILLEASGGTPGRPVGRVGLYSPEHPEGAICSNFLRTLRPKPGVCSAYLRWILLHLHRSPEIWRFQQQTTGMSNLHVKDYLRHELQIAPLAQQQRIAEILSAVDEAIEQTEALIAKTQQIKAGLMHDLFTRGVTADGQLRPPRLEAPQFYKESPLGWIPKEWGAPKLNEIADLDVGFAFKSDWFRSQGVNLLRGENVSYGKPDWRDRQCLDPSLFPMFAFYALHPGDIVIGMDRTFTKSGVKITVLGAGDCPALLVQRVGRFRAIACRTDYLRWIVETSTYLRSLSIQQKGMDIPHLSKSEILSPRVPLAPEYEQKVIAQRLDDFDEYKQCEEESLGKLRVIKSGLMTDLLAGRVPVAVESAPEPKEVAANV